MHVLRRQRDAMKKGRLFLLTFLVVGLGIGLSTYRRWLPDLAWLRIQEIQVSVEAPLTQAEVVNALPKLKGVNLLLLNADALMQTILQNPWARSASIKKEFPNRLVISVEAKQPFALRQDGSRLTFIDDTGAEIDRWSSNRVTDPDLPVIGFEKAGYVKQWNISALVKVLASLQKAVAPKYRLSQIVPSDPPYFKVFLANPPLEMLFSMHTWEGQVPFFVDLLSRPPRQIGQAHKINLVFPKKAVVSLPLSH